MNCDTLAWNPHIPVVVVTVKSEKGVRQSCVRMGGATMETGGTCTPHLRKARGTGGQENLKAYTRTAVLDYSITACNAVCMMQCSFPALNDSVLHICTLLALFCCHFVVNFQGRNFGVKSGGTNSAFGS